MVLTVVAVLVLASINGSIRLHLQVEALLAEQPGHNPFQLRFWKENIEEAVRDKARFNVVLGSSTWHHISG